MCGGAGEVTPPRQAAPGRVGPGPSKTQTSACRDEALEFCPCPSIAPRDPRFG